jgi:hypothetical protein
VEDVWHPRQYGEDTQHFTYGGGADIRAVNLSHRQNQGHGFATKVGHMARAAILVTQGKGKG